jgi:hypothetical protein
MFLESTRILSKSTKRISWYYPETYMEKSGKILNLGENQAEEAWYGGNNNLEPISLEIMPQSRG